MIGVRSGTRTAKNKSNATTDYATSPVTKIGRVIYAIGCGLVTVFIRYFGGYPEGVSFAILIMNLLVWYIDRYTKPVKFGGAKNDNAK